MLKFLTLGFFAFLLTVSSSNLAQACAVCFSSTEESRVAFYITTVFLTMLPVIMLIGGAIWVRNLQKRHDSVD